MTAAGTCAAISLAATSSCSPILFAGKSLVSGGACRIGRYRSEAAWEIPRWTSRIWARAGLLVEREAGRTDPACCRNCPGSCRAMVRAFSPLNGPLSPLPSTISSAVSRAGSGCCSNTRESQPLSSTCSLSDAVSQISMDRKWERFGRGYPTPCRQASSLLPERHQRGQRRMEPELRGELADLVTRNR